MKKKLVTLLLALACVCGVSAFTACDMSGFYGSSASSSNEESSSISVVEVINKSSLALTAGSSDNGKVAYYAKQVITDESDSKIIKKDGYIFYNDNENYYLLGYTGTETELVLPADINGNRYAIYQYAFYDCYRLTSVTIGNSVTTIGQSAFSRCDSLTSVTIGNSVTIIGDYAFYACRSLTSVTIGSSVKSIGEWAFYGCSSLTSVTFENPNGWKRGSTQISATALADTSTAVTYLRDTYYEYTWTREEN